MGINGAEHTIYNANAAVPVLTLASCPIPDRPEGSLHLMTGVLKIKLFPSSAAHHIYKANIVDEEFHCNYELNPVYRPQIEAGGMKFGGESMDGGARILELPGHRFLWELAICHKISQNQASHIL